MEVKDMIKTLMGWKAIKLDNEQSASAFILKMLSDNRVMVHAQGFAMYLRLIDETLQKVQDNPGYILNRNNVIKALEEKGDNIHFFALITFSQNKEARPAIYQGIRDLIRKEHPKSISWYSKDMDRFIYRRLSWHQQ